MLFLVYYIGRYANEISVFFNLRVVSKSPAEISTPIKLSRKFALFSKSVPLVYSVSTVPFIVMQFFKRTLLMHFDSTTFIEKDNSDSVFASWRVRCA